MITATLVIILNFFNHFNFTFNKIYVVTGPIFINNLGSIGKNKVTIPGYYYKALLRFDEQGKTKAIGFLLPNIGSIGEIKNYAVPINTIETLTGIDLFPELDDKVEGRVEASFYTSQWGL